jgi:hypothetical protein
MDGPAYSLSMRNNLWLRKRSCKKQIGRASNHIDRDRDLCFIPSVDPVSQFVEITKAVAGFLKPIAWPCALFASIWIMRHELRGLVRRISKFRIGHKDTTADIELEPELKTAGEVASKLEVKKELVGVADLDKSTATTTTKAEGKITIMGTASGMVTVDQVKRAKALRDSVGQDLEILQQLSTAAAKVPRAAIEQSWEILKRNVIATAKLFGLTPVEGGDSDLHHSVHYLTLYVLESQDVMIGVYSLATVLQKVEKNPDAEVSAKDAQDFVNYCMAIVADLSFEVDRKIVVKDTP